MLEMCSIASGSSGNCICVGSDDTHILIDAGISGRKIEKGLSELDVDPKELAGIMVTHEHIDHVAGIGVMARRYHLPIYGTRGTLEAMKSMKSTGKIDEGLFHVIRAEDEFQVGDLTIKALPVSHDAAEPVAYRVAHDLHRMAVVTDLGIYNDHLVDELQNLDALLLEANHDIHMLQMGPYPYPLKQRILGNYGHLSNESSGRMLCRLLHDQFGAVMLGHLSKDNNYEELAYQAVRMEVAMGDNPYKADDFPIFVAKRDGLSQVLRAE